ncbi:hypothetical protein MPNT_570002 [Candidatus Methylacidithermus pantelleriae]|uniref:Uncharacterized protein n=1 Tax=Candidatus Methylacidithermus pantelleriae TaxID=2744239 RepID=A0A8J2BS31_9BACT|nr:hypothetical protein MPNT_570002 [Candidatus Methylacidithermus pantelleriae]
MAVSEPGAYPEAYIRFDVLLLPERKRPENAPANPQVFQILSGLGTVVYPG